MPSSPRRSTVGLSCLSDRRFSGNLVGGLEGAFGEESVLGEENKAAADEWDDGVPLMERIARRRKGKETGGGGGGGRQKKVAREDSGRKVREDSWEDEGGEKEEEEARRRKRRHANAELVGRHEGLREEEGGRRGGGERGEEEKRRKHRRNDEKTTNSRRNREEEKSPRHSKGRQSHSRGTARDNERKRKRKVHGEEDKRRKEIVVAESLPEDNNSEAERVKENRAVVAVHQPPSRQLKTDAPVHKIIRQNVNRQEVAGNRVWSSNRVDEMMSDKRQQIKKGLSVVPFWHCPAGRGGWRALMVLAAQTVYGPFRLSEASLSLRVTECGNAGDLLLIRPDGKSEVPLSKGYLLLITHNCVYGLRNISRTSRAVIDMTVTQMWKDGPFAAAELVEVATRPGEGEEEEEEEDEEQ
eukprot:GHVS01026029.1.p1 GENE.GHVS01026029.1~~GHVS01026029.1.p1  ORF type:complete len:412 (-),score=114.83 GHVS01026029.1:261-1496(-)